MGWVFAKAVGGAKSWLVGLMVFDALWVGGNGLTIIYCPPPCSSLPFYAASLHLGNLILAGLATYFAYRAMRRISGPGSWLVMVGNIHYGGLSDSDYCSADIAGERLSRNF